MELMKSMADVKVSLTPQEAAIIEQLCAGAWSTGGVRNPKDGETLETLRAKVRNAKPE